ncbi:MAG: hypothetical protein GX417_11570 [Clostridiales bacterium]|nr:hypothetical protein [Clostridiales bacterium]
MATIIPQRREEKKKGIFIPKNVTIRLIRRCVLHMPIRYTQISYKRESFDEANGIGYDDSVILIMLIVLHFHFSSQSFFLDGANEKTHIVKGGRA